MTVVLTVLALGALCFALINLVRPTGRLGVSSRRRAVWWAAASLIVLFVVAGSAPEEPEVDADPASPPVGVGGSTTTSRPRTATSTSTSSTTVTSTTSPTPPPTVPSTTTPSVSATTEPETGSGPPVAGPSGDPDGPLDPSAEIAVVTSITDGDTIEVVVGEGRRERLRLIGVNAPEGGECWAHEATLVLEALIPVGAEIGMTLDRSDRDQFDRLLRYVWVGSMSVNEELVRRGAAISRRYPPDTALADRFEAAQEDARSARLGLWAPDACGPSAEAELEIVELVADAPGNDNENLNGEWLRIQNQGDILIDMTGWGVKDESASHRYRFPGGFSLAPGEVVTIYTGCGDDFGTDLYWCAVGSAIWNNDGDTAFLTDPAGNTHTSREYAP